MNDEDADGVNGDDERGRTTAERVSMAISMAVVLAVLAGIGSLMLRADTADANFVVEVAAVRERGLDHHVHVRVRNDGDRTVENVQVVAELRIDGEQPLEGEQLLHFLAPSTEDEVVFVFNRDPNEGTLDLRVASYATP